MAVFLIYRLGSSFSLEKCFPIGCLRIASVKFVPISCRTSASSMLDLLLYPLGLSSFSSYFLFSSLFSFSFAFWVSFLDSYSMSLIQLPEVSNLLSIVSVAQFNLDTEYLVTILLFIQILHLLVFNLFYPKSLLIYASTLASPLSPRYTD